MLHGDTPYTQERVYEIEQRQLQATVFMSLVICFRSCNFYYAELKFRAIKSSPASTLRKVHRALSSSIKAEWNNVKLFYKLSWKNCSIKMKGSAICKM